MSISRVYKIINDVDELVYIGSTTQILCKRLSNHRDEAKSGNERKLYNHMRNIGIENFKILCVREYNDISKDRLKYKEDKYIKRFDTVKNGLNMNYAFGDKCEHNVRRDRCVLCKGSQICEHQKRKNLCIQCKGSSVCIHNKVKSTCIDCKGQGICHHNKRRDTCIQCKGSSLCSHKNIKWACSICSPAVCEYCKKSYAGKSNLKNHQKKCPLKSNISTEKSL